MFAVIRWVVVALMLAGAIVLVVSYRGRRWEGRERFTVIRLGPPVVVASFDPQTGRGIKIELPDELEIETVGGRGKWRLGVLLKAGEVRWAADSVAEALGVGYEGRAEDLGWIDRWGWWSRGRNVNWEEVALGKTSLVSWEKGADGVEAGHLTKGWEARADTWFVSQAIAQEQLRVKIVNTTTVAGLGSRVARMVERAGMKVAEVTAGAEEKQKCVVSGPAGSVGVRSLVRWLGCGWQPAAEVVVEVGTDYRRKLEGN